MWVRRLPSNMTEPSLWFTKLQTLIGKQFGYSTTFGLVHFTSQAAYNQQQQGK